MQDATRNSTKTVAIIGGGVSGGLTALHLRRSAENVRIVVLDPRPELGVGLAYSTPSLRHLLNVPAGKISALPSEPEHFLRWLRDNHDLDAAPTTFAPRVIFGLYIRSLLTQANNIGHVQTSVTDLKLTDGGVQLVLQDGTVFHADFVVLATGNFDPAPLECVSEAAVESGVYRHNAWSEASYAKLPAEAPVTLIGTGLTSVDVVLRLRELGHRGVITAVSRHGVFPKRHEASSPAEDSAIPASTPATCINYMRALRARIASGIKWRAAVDSLRSTTNDLWLALPVQEQKRFRRHLQRRWDVVRHRMAAPVADMMDAELAQGTLRILKGHVAGVNAELEGARLTLRTAEGLRELQTARVINCTGPSLNYRRVGSPLFESLLANGLATPGPLGGGLNSTRSGALIDAQGTASQRVFNLGPGRLGTLLESIAIPEIREQALELAAMFAEQPLREEAEVPWQAAREKASVQAEKLVVA